MTKRMATLLSIQEIVEFMKESIRVIVGVDGALTIGTMVISMKDKYWMVNEMGEEFIIRIMEIGLKDSTRMI